jgi:hypothetical protein
VGLAGTAVAQRREMENVGFQRTPSAHGLSVVDIAWRALIAAIGPMAVVRRGDRRARKRLRPPRCETAAMPSRCGDLRLIAQTAH